MHHHMGVFPQTVQDLRPHLKQLREARGVSQAALEQRARQAGTRARWISSSTVSRFECAGCDLSLQMFLNFVNTLGLTPADVFPADPATVRPQSPAHAYLHEAVDRLTPSQAEGLVPFVANPPEGWTVVSQPGAPPIQLPRLESVYQLQVGELGAGGASTFRVVGLDRDGCQQLLPMADRALRGLLILVQQLPERLGLRQGSSAPPG